MRRVVLASPLLLAACAGDPSTTGEPPRTPCVIGLPQAGADAVTLEDSCANTASLRPRVRVGGAWLGGGADGPCTSTSAAVTCPAGAAGEVRAAVDGAVVTVAFVAAEDATVEALGLAGEAAIEGAVGWLSNGFQSWSQTGVVALGAVGTDADLQQALGARGDAEVLRSGAELSWGLTHVGGPLADGTAGPSLFAGALSAARWKPWARAYALDGGAIGVELVSGGAGEAVDVAAGATLAGEPFRLELGDGLDGMMERWGAALPSRRSATPRPAEAGWNSWYELWDAVDEPAVRENAALAAELLAPHAAGPLRVVIDDGWQVAWGDWTPNAKFPSGLDGLAADLAADGLAVGVWLAPLLAAEDSAVFTQHPEWFVAGVTYDHPKNGPMHVLDPTHPDAAAHLTDVIQTIVGWGYGLLKIDFLFAGTFEGPRAEAVTGMEAYARALEIIRAAAGEDTILVAVGAPGVPSFPWVDAWRLGADIAFENTDVAWPFLPNQARSVAGRWSHCLATLCDADPVLLRGLPEDEVDLGGWTVALAGGALFLSDDLRVLPAERKAWGLGDGRATLALGGVPSRPIDAYPAAPPAELGNVVLDLVLGETTQLVPSRWALPDGRTLGLNATDQPTVVEGATLAPHAARVLP